MLAALTCLLLKEGQKVVYIPDCRGLPRDAFGYLRHSLRLAFHCPSDADHREYSSCQHSAIGLPQNFAYSSLLIRPMH